MKMLKITATGFNNWDTNFIQTAIALAAGLDVGAWEYVYKFEDADFVLVDARDAAALQRAMSRSEYGGPRIIPCRDEPASADGQTLTLPRPVTYPAVVKLLADLQDAPNTSDAVAVEPSSLETSSSERSAAEAIDEAAQEPEDLNLDDESVRPLQADLPGETDDLTSLQNAYQTQSLPRETPDLSPTASIDDAKADSTPTGLRPADHATSPREQGSPEEILSQPSKTADVVAQWLGETATPQPAHDERIRPEPAGQTKAPKSAAEVLPLPSGEREAQAKGGWSEGSSPSVSSKENEGRAAPSAGGETGHVRETPPPVNDDVLAADTETRHRESVTAGTHAEPAPLSPDDQTRAEARDQNRKIPQFPANARFLAIVRHAVAQGQVTEITHERFPLVRIYPDKRLYSISPDALLDAEIYRRPASEFSVRQVATKHLREAAPEHRTGPLWKLLYLAALYGNEGALKESANYSDKLHLVAEPDFNLVPSIPEHRSIARYMLAETADIVTIAAETGTSVATVIDFSNACDEVLLIERDPPPEDTLSSDTQTEEQTLENLEQPGLLRRLRSLLRRSG